MGVEELGLLVMLQRVQGVLGPAQLLHDEEVLEPGLVVVGGQLHHPVVAALGLLQAATVCLASCSRKAASPHLLLQDRRSRQGRAAAHSLPAIIAICSSRCARAEWYLATEGY